MEGGGLQLYVECVKAADMGNKEDLLRLNPTLFGSIANELGSYLS